MDLNPELSSDLQYQKGNIPFHTHNRVDSPPVDISDIARFPSTASNGDVPVFSTSMNQWVAQAGSSTAYARMFFSGVQSVNDTTETQVNLNNSSLASGITTDTTNHYFVIVTQGVYRISGSLIYGQPIDGGLYEAAIYKNGATELVRVVNNSGSTLPIGVSFDDIWTLAANDTIQLNTFHNSAGAAKTIYSGSPYTFISLELVKAT